MRVWRRHRLCCRRFLSSLGDCRVHLHFLLLNLQDGFSAALPSRATVGDRCSGLPAQRGAVLVSICFDAASDGDRGNETVTSPRDVDDEAIPLSSVAQRAAQRKNMDSQVGGLDKNTGPDASHQFLLADQAPWPFKQNNQDFQSTTSERNCLVAFEQKKLCRQKAKRSE